MDAVILAGGKGTRLGKLTKNLPKPLLKIGGIPLLEHQINLLSKNGIKTIWILSGYLGNTFNKYVWEGKRWKVKVKNIIENKPLGTAGAIKQLDRNISSDFIVLSGDVFCDIDIKKLIAFHKNKIKNTASIVVHPNDHPLDSDLVEVDNNYKVNSFLLRKGKEQSSKLIFRNLANSGVFVFSPKIFQFIKKGKFCDLEKDIFNMVIMAGENIHAYNTPEYIKDIGTMQRLKKVRSDYKLGKPASLNLENKRGAVFLDRDGTILKQDGIHDVKLSGFEFYPLVANAIGKINKLGLLVIIITNQPAIAKGFISESEVGTIHKQIETELGKKGAWINAVYYCPHHPEKGFKGEIKKLKFNCSCRKPKTGLIKKAVRDFNIDLSKSYFIGDSTIDAKCAENVGVKFIGVKTGYGLNDGRYSLAKKPIIFKNLLESMTHIK